MDKIKQKAFTDHKDQGIFLKFPNGNSISTRWGAGNYCDNYDKDFRTSSEIRTYKERLEDSSDTVEIMVNCSELLLELLEEKFSEKSAGGSVFGGLTIYEWLEILELLKKYPFSHDTPILDNEDK